MKDGNLLAGFQNDSEYNQWIGLKNDYYDLVSSAHFFPKYNVSFSIKKIKIKTLSYNQTFVSWSKLLKKSVKNIQSHCFYQK